MFTPARRLFGRAPATSEPLVCDYHVIGRTTPVAPHAPGWQEDLNSLFNLVDAQMVERRGIVAPLPAAAAASRRAGDRPASPPPEGSARGEAADPWFGFGLVDPADAGPAPTTRDDLLAAIEQLVARTLDVALPERVKDELREMVRQAVREAVSEAVRDAITLARSDRAEDPPDTAPVDRASASALVSIRVRRPMLRRRPSGRVRAKGAAPPGTLGLLSR